MQFHATRFWARVQRASPEECWPWTGARTPLGYGVLGVPKTRKNVYAHRLAYFLTHGYWPRVLRHSCDHPSCCNPAHLVDGTQAENLADMRAKGRHPWVHDPKAGARARWG